MRDRLHRPRRSEETGQATRELPSRLCLDAPTPERILEKVERFEEDLTDVARVHRPIEAVVEVGEAIEVSPGRGPKGEADPLMGRIEASLKDKLAALGAQESR